MLKERKSVFDAIAIYVGTAVGAGIFGLPYVFVQAGFWFGVFYLVFLSLVFLILYWLYSEVVLRTKDFHHLTGYAEKYLGRWGKRIALVALLFGFYGALTAYLIGLGEFLNNLLGPYLNGNATVYGLGLFGIFSLAILLGLGTVALLDRFMVVILLLVVVIVVLVGLPHVDYQNYLPVKWSQLFLPYGVVFFALAAGSAVPNMARLLPDKKKLKRVIFIAWLIPSIIYFLFTAVVVGITGVHTTETAITGLSTVLGHWVLPLGSLFGILTMGTSFLCLGVALKEIYKYDFHLPNFFSWLLVVVIPLIIYLLKLGGFISIMSVAGAIMGGLDGILMVLIWQRAKKLGDRQPEYSIKLPKPLIYFLFGIFIFGIGYQIYFTLIR